MATPAQLQLFAESIEKPITEHRLRRSLQQIGPQRPVYIWDDHVLDGKRRLALCEFLHLDITRVELTDRIQAARLLYSLHPRRAMEVFHRARMRRDEMAFLFGVDALELPSKQQLCNAVHQRRGVMAYHSPTMAVIGGIPFERAKLERAKRACRERFGVSFAGWLRARIETDLLGA